MLVCHQSFYARRDLCPSYQIQYRFSADYDWCIRIMKRAEMLNLPLLNTHMVLSDYLSEGMTTQNHKASLVERLRIMGKHYSWPVAVKQHLWFILRSLKK